MCLGRFVWIHFADQWFLLSLDVHRAETRVDRHFGLPYNHANHQLSDSKVGHENNFFRTRRQKTNSSAIEIKIDGRIWNWTGPILRTIASRNILPEFDLRRIFGEPTMKFLDVENAVSTNKFPKPRGAIGTTRELKQLTCKHENPFGRSWETLQT